MPFAPELQDAVDELVRGIDGRALERAARSLSERYRAGGTAAARATRSTADVAAYLATRAPATYAAVEDVLARIRVGRPAWRPRSLLDLGAGPGITLVEAEGAMVEAGRALGSHGGAALREARWVQADAAAAVGEADLVIASYLLNELEPEALAPLVERAWRGTTDTLVVIEPGTTTGYARVIFARDRAVGAGGSVLAPCPHDRLCPLPAGDWCHFPVRLPRSRLHRTAKGAELGYEDEKLSYVVVCREWHPRHEARVIRRPALHGGHVGLDLCTTSGLEQRTVSKRHGAAYKVARKLGWGDAL
jgi:ribosomal protein RSM22 (predicted rRNA methylase)